ncbi:MAG: helix-turn-helix transcriptional regulator [Clostridia bacterium]|nr:helix-turn-helix transcriptional regulator [Clostridia bacterium]
MKQSEVCEYIGVSRNTYLSYENPDRTSYPEGLLNKLAECLGVSVESPKLLSKNLFVKKIAPINMGAKTFVLYCRFDV